MAEQLTRVEINCTTGEETIVPLTAEEIAELEKMQAELAKQRAAMLAEAQAKEEAKASAFAKLLSLGLTEEEAKAITGA